MQSGQDDRAIDRASEAGGVPSGDLAQSGAQQRSGVWRSWNRFKRYKPALVGLAFMGILAILAIFPGVFAPYTATENFSGMSGEGPSLDHPLGMDNIGRDMLSRMIFGARTALVVALTATLISGAIGIIVGSVSGYFSGWVDATLSRVVDALMAFPLLVLLIALVNVLGAGLETIVLVIGVVVWPPYARLVRADIMSLREQDFVMAAIASGARAPRIILRHMLPNTLAPVIVYASLSVGSIIILEAALSFLGLGIQPPDPSWGGILSEGRGYMRAYPHIAIIPGVMIMLTVLAFNVIGDGLRDALDPRQRD